MSKKERVYRYYKAGMWTLTMVRNAVAKGWITEDEYTELTGEEYIEG